MAENKLSWSELRRALAARAGVSEKEANAFLNAFQTQLVEALKQDKQVKVNGLGTFKLQAVAPRKSVNVTTGEEITIEGYNKIAFVPEAGVKELVESVQPSAISQVRPASEIDPLQKLGTQAEEIVDILGELGQAPEKAKGKGKKVSEKKAGEKKASGKAKAKAKKAESVVEAEVVAEPEPVVAPVVEPVVEPIVEPVVEAEPIVIPPIPTPMPEPVIEPSNPEPAPEKPKKEYHFLRDVIICVVILLFLLLGAFFFMRHQLSSWLESMINNDPVQTEVVVETNSEEIASAAEETEVNAEEPSMFDFDNLFSNIEMPDMSVLSSTKERLVSTCDDAYNDIKLWVMNLVQEVTGYFGIDDLGLTGLPSGEEEVIEEVAIEDVEIEEVMPEEITAEAVTPEEVVTEPVVKPAAAVKAVRSSIPSYKSAEYSEWITTEYIAYGSRLAWIAKKYYGDKIYWPYLYDANRDHISNPSNITVGTAIRVPKLSAAQRDTTSAAFKQLREEAYNAVR